MLPARRTLAQNYIQGLTTVFDMTPNQIQTAIMGSIAHSRLSIEETVFDIPLEINRRTKTGSTYYYRGRAGRDRVGESGKLLERMLKN